MDRFTFPRKLLAEGLGTTFLLAAVVGSGIMGEQLSDGNIAIALLANALATGAVLVVLIFIFAPVSGAHFNPAVSLSFVLQGKMRWLEFMAYTILQITGAVAGVVLAHAMFDHALISISSQTRTGSGIWIGEIVATFGLIAAIISCSRNKPEAIPYAIGLYIFSAYWFTSSTSFANPAVTIARTLTDSFSGIRPDDAFAFIAAQILGALLATAVFCWVYKKS